MAGSVNQRGLTKHIRALAAQISTEHFDDEGNALTNEEALARLLWKKALGWTEETRDDEGNRKIVRHKPESWAMQYLYDRMEGKIAHAQTDDAVRIKAADRVRELAKQRLNQLATAVAGPKGPPRHRPPKSA